ncbi:hypothetical protein [Micromonospora sp. CP22]|uniref:hypothetical protein n=1 Tax=Micromonospora sp. CP22 TaxID=2580517 RepID=UPI0012BBAA53|nr:hypothetical protein [Micromonospora sp. CP22]MTK03995.1 hypothetical protein [Micromonospora sp. CP22]
MGAALTGLLTGSAVAAVPVGHGGDRTIPVSPRPGHLRLLAPGVSSVDPMTAVDPEISTSTRNTNIAWRTVDSVRLTAGARPVVRPFAIGNSLTVPSRHEVIFVANESLRAIGGRVLVDLGPELLERWRAGGAVGTGVRLVGRTRVEIVETTWASLGEIMLKPGERTQFSLRFSAEAASDGELCLAVVQLGPNNSSSAERAYLGGVQYLITSTDH